MVAAQKVKQSEITEQDSLLLTRNLLRIAIFNISYIRGLFPEKYFIDKSVPALDMKIKKLMPLDAESRRLIDWMEKGVYDALQNKYLKTLYFCICEGASGPMIEEYTFSFSYSNSESQEVLLNIKRSGSKKGGMFKHNSTCEITPSEMRSSACKMVRTLIQLMRTLDKMPEERTILMKLLYYDDVTPREYEPPFFRECSEEEACNPWSKNPLKMEVGKVNSKHLVLALKVKSVLDPCEDENNEVQDNEMSMGADPIQNDESSDSGSEMRNSDDDQYVVAPVDQNVNIPSLPQNPEDDATIQEDNTQDPAEDAQQLMRVKDWINSYHFDVLELTDVLSNFPDISKVLIEEIMDMLVKEGSVSKATGGSYVINKKEALEYDFEVVKDEFDGQIVLNRGKPGNLSFDHVYMLALYHTLPLDYITAVKLHKKLGGDVSLNMVRKLIDKMTHEGFLDISVSRKLGKRVIHSDLTEKKLLEVKKLLKKDVMELVADPSKKSNLMELEKTANSKNDLSTCGGLHSIGSDVTRTRERSNVNISESMRSINGITGKSDHAGDTPISILEPAASRESFVPGADGGRSNGDAHDADEVDDIMESTPTQEKRSRKASMVKDPILQYTKRQKR